MNNFRQPEFLFLFSIIFLASCSNKASPVIEIPGQRNHSVSVFNGSTKVENLNKELVKRIQVSRNSLPGKVSSLPFRFQMIKGKEGESIGLKLLKGKGVTSNQPNPFGLEQGDIVRALDRSSIQSVKQLNGLIPRLEENGEASLIVERAGEVLKYFYHFGS